MTVVKAFLCRKLRGCIYADGHRGDCCARIVHL